MSFECSRCGSYQPMPECYVCWIEPEPEKDGCLLAKEQEYFDEIENNYEE
jgi:hypothetical protein